MYKRQYAACAITPPTSWRDAPSASKDLTNKSTCLLYTSDAADEEDSVDLGGRRHQEGRLDGEAAQGARRADGHRPRPHAVGRRARQDTGRAAALLQGPRPPFSQSRRSACPLPSAAGSVGPAFPRGSPRAKGQPCTPHHAGIRLGRYHRPIILARCAPLAPPPPPARCARGRSAHACSTLFSSARSWNRPVDTPPATISPVSSSSAHSSGQSVSMQIHRKPCASTWLTSWGRG